MGYRKARRGSKRNCREKVVYPTRAEAVDAGHQAGKAAYYCEAHGAWHLSSRGGARL